MIRFTSSAERSARARRHRARPQAEPLEDRQLLTAGQLDPTFGGAGYLLTSPWSSAAETYIDRACAVEVLSDGSILVAGDSADQFALMKFRANGALDTSFGSGGRVLTSLLNGDMASDMAIQPDGKIVLVGQVDASVSGKGSVTYNRDFGVLRFNANGTLDTTFGPSRTGMISLGVSSATASGSANQYDYAYAVAIQPDGKILVGGRSFGGAATSDDSSLVRLKNDGTLDATFGLGGKVITPFGTGVDQIREIAVLPDGRILVGGYVANTGSGSKAFVARYLANGAVDPTFGSNGIATLFNTGYFTFGDGANMVVDPASGSITVAGTFANGSNSDIALARLTADGAIDSGFGTGGTSVVGTAADEYVTAIARQADGRIIAVGYVVSGGVHNAMVARFEPGGALDASFGNSGFATNSFSADEILDDLYDVTIQPDGNIVAVGKATASVTKKSTDRDFLIARYQGDPAPLLASAASPTPVRQSITAAQARPALAQALAYWRSRGDDTSQLGHIDLVIADLGGDRLGEASSSTITLDDNAAGWGWAVGRGRGPRAGRMSLLTALTHEVGHLLGHEHAEGGVMADTLAPGVGSVPASSRSVDGRFPGRGRRSPPRPH